MSKPNIEGVLRAWLTEVQELEDVAFDVLRDRWLDTAVGVQLDVLGVIVGEPRLGRDDDTYRLHLRVRVAINRSNGIVNELINILNLLLPGVSVRIDEQYPAAIVAEIEDAIDEDLGSQVAQLFCSARAAGVKCLVHWFRAGDVFAYSVSGAPELASPEGFGNGDYSATSDGSAVHTFVP